jgi:DNA-binding XRE family transcriptional regulator
MDDPTRPHPRGVSDEPDPAHAAEAHVVPLALWALCVRAARRHAGLSQDELAQAAAVTQQTISKIEAGKACPTDGVKVRLAIALGISPGTLFPWPPTVLWAQVCDLARKPLDEGRGRPATDD